MAMDPEDRSPSGRRRTDAKEERRLFPFWTLIVIAGCAALWIFGAKAYEQMMAAYESYAAISHIAAQEGFAQGVSVDDIDLSGMTMQEAEALFAQKRQETFDAFALVVRSGERQWLITSNEVPVTYDIANVLERAYAVGRVGSLSERVAERERTKENGAAFYTDYTYDRTAVRALTEIIAENLQKAPVDATVGAFDPNNKTFTFTKESVGYEMDREALESEILAALDARKYDKVITPVLTEIQPQVRTKELEGKFGLVSSYSTTTTKDADRNTNISISAAALNGRMVKPGETLSFNDCTGKRTMEKGYREAHAIAGGMLIDDTGGGVCQTSSTLFNAVIRADMGIVKRYAHSWPSTYVNKGEDATVNWPSLDFVFRNTSDYPIFLLAWYEKQTVTVEVYGRMLDDGVTIELESETIKTMKPSDDILYTKDESLPQGSRQKGRSKRTGYVVDTYKVYKSGDGTTKQRVKLWTTTYNAQQDEILYN